MRAARAAGAAEELPDAARADAAVLTVPTRLHPPAAGKPTRHWSWISIARLGGFPARKGNGNPGRLTLWRGWQTLMLMLMVKGYELSTG